MRIFGALFLARVFFLATLYFQNGSLGLIIYSALPEHVVEWLKRRILIEIKSVGEFRKEDLCDGQTRKIRSCSSSSGPFCRHIKHGALEEARVNLWKDVSPGEELLEMLLTSSPHSLKETGAFDKKQPSSVKLVSTKLNDYRTLLNYCRLPIKDFYFCIKTVFRSLYDSVFNYLFGKIPSSIPFTQFDRFWKTVSKYFRGRGIFKKHRNRRPMEIPDKRSQAYIVTGEFSLPPPDYNLLDTMKTLRGETLANESNSFRPPGYPLREELSGFQQSSKVLFDETFRLFLKSRFVRYNLINSLTWVLEQSTPFTAIQEDWRNEALNRNYIIVGSTENKGRNDKMIFTCPYTGTRVTSELLNGKFNDKFEKVRTTWNGVSSKMEFSSIRPDIRLLPDSFCNDEKLECAWEGFWELYREESLGVELLSQTGQFQLKNEKIVLSDLPVTVRDSILQSYSESKDKEKTISISGFYNSKLMWRSIIPLNELLEVKYEVDGASGSSILKYRSKWVNALDFADTVPYSMVNKLQFETSFLLDPNLGGIILGSFCYNLLNPAFNYIPRGVKRNFGVVNEKTSELSLVMYFTKSNSVKEDQVTSISLTTMYISKASPMISLYNIETRGLYLKDEIEESTLCTIKRNMAEVTKDN
ncbi:transmembrane protein [Cryptosporidium felis]|nr:transmembrane protein [Cryptosporidium felis]